MDEPPSSRRCWHYHSEHFPACAWTARGRNKTQGRLEDYRHHRWFRRKLLQSKNQLWFCRGAKRSSRFDNCYRCFQEICINGRECDVRHFQRASEQIGQDRKCGYHESHACCSCETEFCVARDCKSSERP